MFIACLRFTKLFSIFWAKNLNWFTSLMKLPQESLNIWKTGNSLTLILWLRTKLISLWIPTQTKFLICMFNLFHSLKQLRNIFTIWNWDPQAKRTNWKDKKVCLPFRYFSKYLEYYYIPSISKDCLHVITNFYFSAKDEYFRIIVK